MKTRIFTNIPVAIAAAAAIACGRLWAASTDTSTTDAGVPDTASASVAAPAPAPADSAGAGDSAVARANSAKKNEPVLLIKTKKDTIIIIANEDKDRIEKEVHKVLNSLSINVKKSRVQGYGGAGGFSHRMIAFNMTPVADLVTGASGLSGISFPSLKGGYEMLIMAGGLGYGGLGQGIRIGGGGYGCSRKFVSKPFKRTQSSPDSIISLKMDIGYGGLLIEKAIVNERWNIYMGSFIGGGDISIEGTIAPAGGASAFGNKKIPDPPTADFMSMEFHGGATYTLVPWMHIGGDFNALFYYSNNGFELPTSGGIYGIAPGFGIRVVFGNIG